MGNNYQLKDRKPDEMWHVWHAARQELIINEIIILNIFEYFYFK